MAADTIAAIATAPGKAGVAVVRVSGPDAFLIAEKLTGKPVARISHSRIRSFDYSDYSDYSIIDDALVLTFKSPHSYTGEDVVEFQCHGGSVTPRRVLEACFAAGARLARRGEFTERAFLNGKMDLSEAESVIDLIEAKTDAAADDALSHLGGTLKNRYRALYDQAVQLSSELEHSLDVDDSDLSEEFLKHLNSSLFTLHSSLQKAIEQAKHSTLLKDGALVVLAGPPNAGKSSLLNALLGESRAIVSDVPGTTRDSIEAWIDLGGIPVRLVDTAGLRGTSDAIESEGVRRAEELIAKADIVLMLEPSVDAASLPREKDGTYSFEERGKDASSTLDAVDKTILILSKSDLLCSPVPVPRSQYLSVSAKTGEGMDDLRKLLISKLADLEPKQNSRGLDLLMESEQYAREGARATESGEIVLAANAVRAAAETLGKLIGATYSEDLLDALFSRFCVGK